jgi:hypothetical protein
MSHANSLSVFYEEDVSEDN